VAISPEPSKAFIPGGLTKLVNLTILFAGGRIYGIEDVLSHVLKKRRSASLMERLKAIPKASQFTSAVNVAEIYFGIFRKEGWADLLRFFKDEIFSRLTILPFDRDSGRIFGRIKADIERKGLPRFEPDLQIAAVAIANT
jgi:tRNA(fMet)-specific endonuclease VapC